MKKTLITVFIFMIGLLSLTMTGCNNDKKAATEEDPCADEVTIATLQTRIYYLDSEITSLRQQLNDCLGNKTAVVTTPTRTTPPAPRVTTPAPKVKIPTPKPTPTKAEAPARSATIGRANLDGLREGGIISFCVMANGDGGLHFPQKALDQGVTFTSIERNPTNDGSNWIVEPVEWIDGDYGLTVDGTFFVSNELLVRVLGMDGLTLTKLQIKAPFTKWALRDMTLQDDYWIYKAI